MRFQGRIWQWFKNALVILLVLSFVLAFTGRFHNPSDRLPKNSELAPFSLPNLQNPGTVISAKDLAGKGVMLHFWASWCRACKRGMPAIEALHKRFSGNNFLVLGITDDNPQAAANYLKSQGYSFPTVWDRGSLIGSRYKVRSIPFTVFFAPDGKVAGDLTGAVSESDGAERIEALLSSKAAPAAAPIQEESGPKVRVE
jgi:thiol-disulfide isomerase/thioredoxin